MGIRTPSLDAYVYKIFPEVYNKNGEKQFTTEVRLEGWEPKEEGVFIIVCLLGTVLFSATCMYTFLRNVCLNIHVHTHTFTHRKNIYEEKV